MDKVKILYIAGLGRSGTTLIDRLIGEAHGFVSVGELRHIWKRSFQGNQMCGCGKPFNDCSTWKKIINRTFSGPLSYDKLTEIVKIQAKLNRLRYHPFLKTRILKNELKIYIEEFLKPLYLAIQEEYPGDVIVDSSKIPSYLNILHCCDFIDLKVLHVVREPQAVAYSWMRKKVRPDFAGKREYMPTINPVKIAILWNIFNYLISRTGCSMGKHRYRIISYDSFAKNPLSGLSELLEFMGYTGKTPYFISHNSAYLSINHSVSGNPMRFKTGEIAIRHDMRWKNEMRVRDKTIVSMLTSLQKHKYLNGAIAK